MQLSRRYSAIVFQQPGMGNRQKQGSNMNRLTAVGCSLLLLALPIMGGCRQESPQSSESHRQAPTPHAEPSPRAQAQTGEELFKQYCAPCHPDGGNVSDPERNLRGYALKSNHITKPEDIVRIMRHPISRMIRFDESTISDRDAAVLADYILKTFK